MTMLENLQRLARDNRPQQDVRQLVHALRTCSQIQHPPRSDAKAQYLASQGLDPAEAFPELR